jgi:hypothetical protein
MRHLGMAQNPFQDVMSQRELHSQGGAMHAVVNVRVAQGRTVAALHHRAV